MRTDRELLEAAAKAAGLYADGYRAQFREPEGWVCIRPADETCPFQSVWAPLTDDGDALRLAVKLRMRVHHDGSCATAELPTGQRYCWTEAAIHEDNDHAAAIRRAIVRAAAEMAK